MQNSKLKPCPFCGYKSSLYVEKQSEEQWFVFCCNCCAGGPYSQTKEQAIADWNRRAEEK